MKLLTTLLSLCVFTAMHAQESSVEDWQKSHPNVLFFESSDISPEKIEILNNQGVDFIVYKNEITINDIELYSNEVNAKSENVQIAKGADADAIKIWLAQHTDLKIIKNSFFQELAEIKQNEFLNSDALILQGEYVTIQDIENYEATH